MIVLGRVSGAHGVRGAVKVHAFGDDPLSWGKMLFWWLGTKPDSTDAADWKTYRLISLREQGSNLVATLDNVADRSAAESLQGFYIAAPREDLPKPGFDEYYWADLIGLQVVNKAGVELGQVVRLLETGAHDVLVLEYGEADAKQERLIPFVAAFVHDVVLPERRITVEWEADW